MPGDVEPKKRGRGILKFIGRMLVLLIVLAVLVAAAGGLGAYMAYQHITQPRIGGMPMHFEVPAGATGMDIAQILTDEGLIEHPLLFRVAIRLSESDDPIKAGGYMVQRGLSPMQYLEQLREGPDTSFDAGEVPDELKVSVPEGLTLQQMSERFDDPDAFLEAASDPELIARIGIDAPTLEGFVMPNTYFFDEEPTEREAVVRMVEQFEKEYAALLQEFPEAAERDPLEVLTIASLVEEETRVDDERPIVASVIYERIERGMPLDLDSTLQYALNKYGQRMLNEDKEVDSPYNTYRNAGLPPGPISNPGVASIRAALAPADTDYLFFVSNADGKTHTFSRTMSEHAAAVRKYRREIAEQRRALARENEE